MVAYNFQAQFADAIVAGHKRQTIRAERKRHARVGEHLQLYVGQRTRACRKLIDPDPFCLFSTYCALRADGVTLGNYPKTDLDAFARRDGFDDFDRLLAWFADTHGLPFVGRLIGW